jgi:hypothetical protein
MKNNWNRAFTFIGAVLFLGSTLHGEEKCPAEVKLLLSPAEDPNCDRIPWKWTRDGRSSLFLRPAAWEYPETYEPRRPAF